MRPILEPAKVAETALQKMNGFHSATVEEVKQAVASNKVVVVGMATNPFCTKARNLLKEKGVEFKYLEYGSYVSGWKPRLAIKLWSGWPTYPQVFVDGRLIGGYMELKAHLNG
jgi:glutaredoxin-related protein